MFGELKQRSVLWDVPRTAAKGVGVNLLHGVVFVETTFFFLPFVEACYTVSAS